MRSIIYIFPVLLLFSCGGDNSKSTKKKSDAAYTQHVNKGPDYEKINNCLRTTLSYKLQVEPREYDSLATYYFHEIRDYTNPKIRGQNHKLKNLKQQLKDSAQTFNDDKRKMVEGEIDLLQQEINSHFKEIIGYVFVHSFILKDKDTMSAIFVMDMNCGFKELIKVKVISDPNPEDYIESIRQIYR